MPLTINVPDTLRKAVEAASGGLNTVLYTAKKQPCYMRVVPKFTLQSIDASLGTGTHPAFIVNGVEKDSIFIGQHIGSSNQGEMLSVPGVDPINSITHDAAVTLARANGTGWHVMTNVEWAALALWCWKNGFQPRGNTQYGRSSDVTTEIGTRSDGRPVTGSAQGSQDRTLTGSGPTTWRHDATPFGIADLNGNVWEWTPGMRINNGEINILANNNAAMNTADMSAGSAEWKAIDGATGALVAPGTVGTVKFGNANSGTGDYTLYRASGSTFQGMVNSTGANPVGTTALALVKSLALFPIASSGLGDDIFYLNTAGERVPIRGGAWNLGASAGVFTLILNDERTGSNTGLGARPAFVL